MKIKVLEETKSKKYLIERYYRKIEYVEYVVCESYDFDTNTYANGLITNNLPLAYQTFNTFVIENVLKADVSNKCL